MDPEISDFDIFVCQGKEVEEDEKLLLLLKEWDLEKIYLILRHASVGIEELRYLTETDLCQIFPSVEVVGTKAKLREKIKLWKKDEFGEGEDLTAALQKVNQWLKHNDRHQSSTLPSSETPPSQCSFECDIQTILVHYPRGKDSLEYYEDQKTLTPYHQQSIANCVIDHYLASRKKLSLNDLDKIADSICKYFPGERSATYFGRRGDSKRSCGKLYDRYFNSRKGKTLTSCSNTQRGDNTIRENTEVDEILSKKLQIWLKYNDNPLEEIEDKWKTTHPYRKLNLKNSLKRGETISSFMNEWPLYKHYVLGPKLINWDFEILYPKKGTHLLTKWDDFLPLVHNYYKTNIKDKVCRELLNQLENENITADTRNYITSILLNAVITPVARYKKNASIIRVTIQEGMDSFLVHINSASNLEETLVKIRERFSQENNILQPVVIATGSSIKSLDNFFVYLDGTKLKLSSFLAALDLCFKIFQVFDVHYPQYCSGVWLFIQQFFLKLARNTMNISPK